MINKILAIALDGFEETELITPIDILRRGGVTVDFATVGKTILTSSHGFKFYDLLLLENLNLDGYNGVFLPGGGHYEACLKNNEIINTLKYFHDKDKFLLSICAGPTILGSLGYLKDKNYTCFPKMNKDFGGYYHYQYAVRDGKLITGQACASSVDFGLLILQSLTNEKNKTNVMKSIYY